MAFLARVLPYIDGHSVRANIFEPMAATVTVLVACNGIRHALTPRFMQFLSDRYASNRLIALLKTCWTFGLSQHMRLSADSGAYVVEILDSLMCPRSLYLWCLNASNFNVRFYRDDLARFRTLEVYQMDRQCDFEGSHGADEKEMKERFIAGAVLDPIRYSVGNDTLKIFAIDYLDQVAAEDECWEELHEHGLVETLCEAINTARNLDVWNACIGTLSTCLAVATTLRFTQKQLRLMVRATVRCLSERATQLNATCFVASCLNEQRGLAELTYELNNNEDEDDEDEEEENDGDDNDNDDNGGEKMKEDPIAELKERNKELIVAILDSGLVQVVMNLLVQTAANPGAAVCNQDLAGILVNGSEMIELIKNLSIVESAKKLSVLFDQDDDDDVADYKGRKGRHSGTSISASGGSPVTVLAALNHFLSFCFGAPTLHHLYDGTNINPDRSMDRTHTRPLLACVINAIEEVCQAIESIKAIFDHSGAGALQSDTGINVRRELEKTQQLSQSYLQKRRVEKLSIQLQSAELLEEWVREAFWLTLSRPGIGQPVMQRTGLINAVGWMAMGGHGLYFSGDAEQAGGGEDGDGDGEERSGHSNDELQMQVINMINGGGELDMPTGFLKALLEAERSGSARGPLLDFEVPVDCAYFSIVVRLKFFARMEADPRYANRFSLLMWLEEEERRLRLLQSSSSFSASALPSASPQHYEVELLHFQSPNGRATGESLLCRLVFAVKRAGGADIGVSSVDSGRRRERDE